MNTTNNEELRKAWAEYRAMLNITIAIWKDKVLFWRVYGIGMTIVCLILTYIATRK